MTYQVEVLPQALGDIELAYRWMADKLGAQVAEDWYDELMEAVRIVEVVSESLSDRAGVPGGGAVPSTTIAGEGEAVSGDVCGGR
jgi:plasmid stabilization system protein ParE